jgi:hypothetical protein
LLVDPEEEDVHGANLRDCVVLAQPQHLGREGGRAGEEVVSGCASRMKKEEYRGKKGGSEGRREGLLTCA